MPTKTHTFSRGFTLVELLIVIAVIGILAGVVYTVTTSGMKNSSKTSLQTTASAVSSQLKAAANEGRFPNTLPDTFKPDESDAVLEFALTGADYYCVNVTHKKYDDLKFYFDSLSTEVKEGDCSQSTVLSGEPSGGGGGGGGVSSAVVTTLAGYGPTSNGIVDVLSDGVGNTYLAEDRRIMKHSGGTVSVLAGSTSSGYVNANGASARFGSIFDIEFAPDGSLYVVDSLNSVIRKVTTAGSVTTYAGSSQGYVDGSAGSARFSAPSGIGVANDGTVYVADTGNYTLRKITPSGSVSTLAGDTSTYTSRSCLDGSGQDAMFNAPYDVAVGKDGNVYMVDYGCANIRRVTPAGAVATIAGDTGGVRGNVDANGTAARFRSLYAITTDTSGNLLVSDYGNDNVRKVTTAGSVTTFAGTDAGYLDGEATAAKFRDPAGLSVGSEGKVYVADRMNGYIRIIDPS